METNEEQMAAAWAKGRGEAALLDDPFAGMVAAGLFRIGLPAPWGTDGGYAAMARMEAALVARTGLAGLGAAWLGRQMVARHFIAGFADAAQREAVLPRVAAGDLAIGVAISEPGVGAHPRLLTTRAVPDGAGWRLSGEKAWVTNGPVAGLFVVFAVEAEALGRKRYGAFLVPADAPGLALKEQPHMAVLRPSRHCGLVLDGVAVPATARLGPVGSAYETMALPFRDVEDAVGAAGMHGALRWLAARFGSRLAATPPARPDEAVLWLGGLAGLVTLFGAGAEAAAAHADAGRAEAAAALTVGMRETAAEVLRRLAAADAPVRDDGADPALARLIGDITAALNVARGPRAARQARLGEALIRKAAS
jgi:acyl-CoA dehydrogenase